MFIIETVGGTLLGMSAIAFFLVAAFDKPLQNWLGADRNVEDNAGAAIRSAARPKRASSAMPAAHVGRHRRQRETEPLKKAA